MGRGGRCCCVLLLGVWCVSVTAFAGQKARPIKAAKPAATSSTAKPQAAPRDDFAEVSARAAAAREAARLDEAIVLYRQAVKLQPLWGEGWWYLATLLYDRSDFAEAAHGFRETIRLQPKVGATWAMLGLCEFQLGGYTDALAHIQKGRATGLADNKELVRTLLYHEGLILVIQGQFEQAQKILDGIVDENAPPESLVLALGLSVLRVPVLPKDIDVNNKGDRELIRRAGVAESLAAQKKFDEARGEYERLTVDFPRAMNVQYAYGRYLVANRDDEKAAEAFKSEIANSPNHSLARMQIAYIKLLRKEPAEGIAYAEEAVNYNPRSALAYYILGRLLFDTKQNERAITALETAKRLTPDDAKIYFSLARAYTRAKRKSDADAARATFERLNRTTDSAAAGQGAQTIEAGDKTKVENDRAVAP